MKYITNIKTDRSDESLSFSCRLFSNTHSLMATNYNGKTL